MLFTKKVAPKLIFFNDFFWKDSDDFLHRKFTLKDQNWHFFDELSPDGDSKSGHFI